MQPIHFIGLAMFVFLFYILYRSAKTQNRWSQLLDKSNELNERALKLLERQEKLMERHEKLMDRLEKIKVPNE